MFIQSLISFLTIVFLIQAQLEIGPGTESITSVNFDLVMGDRSGYLHMQDTQRMYLEYDEFAVVRSSPPVNFIIKEGAEMWASADFKVIGTAETAFQVRV